MIYPYLYLVLRGFQWKLPQSSPEGLDLEWGYPKLGLSLDDLGLLYPHFRKPPYIQWWLNKKQTMF